MSSYDVYASKVLSAVRKWRSTLAKDHRFASSNLRIRLGEYALALNEPLTLEEARWFMDCIVQWLRGLLVDGPEVKSVMRLYEKAKAMLQAVRSAISRSRDDG